MARTKALRTLWLLSEGEASVTRERLLGEGLTVTESRNLLLGLGAVVGIADKLFAVDEERREEFFDLCDAAKWRPQAVVSVGSPVVPARATDEFLFLPRTPFVPGSTLPMKLRYMQVKTQH